VLSLSSDFGFAITLTWFASFFQVVLIEMKNSTSPSGEDSGNDPALLILAISPGLTTDCWHRVRSKILHPHPFEYYGLGQPSRQCCIEDKELFLSVIRKLPAAGCGSLMNVLPKLFSAHDGRQRCRESLKLDKCSLEDDPRSGN
jgi:hypothetical protein